MSRKQNMSGCSIPDADSSYESNKKEQTVLLHHDRDASMVEEPPGGSDVSFPSSYNGGNITHVVRSFPRRIRSFFSSTPLALRNNALLCAFRFWENVITMALLLWKNIWLLALKRHYYWTLLQIGLPLILTIIFATINAQFIPNETGAKNVTSFRIVDEMELVKRLYDKTECLECVVAYEPQTDFTKRIVSNLQDLYYEMLQQKNWHEIKEWKGFNSELEIQAYWLSPQQNGSVDLKAAILFQDGFNISTDHDYADNHNFSYTILIPDLTDTIELIPGLFPYVSKRNVSDPYDITASALQILLDKVLTAELSKVGVPNEKILLQAFPRLRTPIRNSEIFGKYFNIWFAALLSLGFIFTVPFVVGPIVREKESGIRELMHVHGLSYWENWFGWFLCSMLFQLLTITIVIGLLFIPINSAVGGIVKRGSFSLWMTTLVVYSLAATSWCILISSLSYDPTIAISVGAFLWLGTYLLLAGTSFYGLSIPWKFLLCLFPNLALTFCTELLLAFDERFEGASWEILFTPRSSTEPFTIGYAIIEMLLSCILYNLLALYFESIISSKLGVRKPWNFIFKPPIRENSRWRSSPDEIKASRPVHLKLSHLKKDVGGKEIFYIESHTFKVQEITVLYGPNGSGKTMLLSILAGLVAPTRGTAYFDGIDITQDIDSFRKRLGYCPQSNILFDDLTVAEHLIFFGMLKEKSWSEATRKAKYIIPSLHLHEKKDVLSSCLSGGQKRKLNLGMAAVGDNNVLLLDEPTSGVDLESRYSIRKFLAVILFLEVKASASRFCDCDMYLSFRIGLALL